MGFFLFGYYAMHQDFTGINLWTVAGGIIGSYLPDCDHAFAPAGKYLPLHKLTQHRQHTHSLYFAVVASALLGVVNIWLGVGCLAGFLLHLFADKQTYMGQKEGLSHIFWPYHIKRGT